MLYRVDYKDGKWFIGNAEVKGTEEQTAEQEVAEFIARRYDWPNMNRAHNFMKSIMKNSKKYEKNKKS